METDHQTSLTFFSFIESVKATIFLKDTSLSTEKGGSWVNVKSDLNWPGAQYNLEITEIQPHLKTTVSPSDCPTSNNQRKKWHRMRFLTLLVWQMEFTLL